MLTIKHVIWIAGTVAAWLAMQLASADPGHLPRLEPTVIEANLDELPDSERAALARIIHAARRMDVLYIRQVWPGTYSLIQERQGAANRSAQGELTALNFFKGPWLPNGTPIVAGVPATRPIGDFYPANAAKSDIEAWLEGLGEQERAHALGSFTAIRRGADERFIVVPYSRHYAPDIKAASDDLLQAAKLTREPTLERYLRARAKALLDDDYYASDVAFVGLKGPIDVVLGPYEVDDDEWFGAKTAFEASIAIVNKPATLRTASAAVHLQELEDHLPLAAVLRGRKLGASAPVLVLDAVYNGGMAGAGGLPAGYGLPNDLRVLKSVGARTGTYSNILKQRYENTFQPIAAAALASSDRATLRFEDILDEILMVRLFDSLGPQYVTGTTQPIADALQEKGSVATQIRSMLLSLWGHRYLVEHGYRDRRESNSLYAAFLVPAVARIRAGLNSPASQGSTYVLNQLIKAGAIHTDEKGRLTIDVTRADAEVTRAADEFISLMAKGDAVSIRTLLARDVVVRPEIKAVLDRMGAPPPLQRPVYLTADQLDPPDRGEMP